MPASSRGEDAWKDRRTVTALPIDALKPSWADRSPAQAGPLTSGMRNFFVADGLFCQEKRDRRLPSVTPIDQPFQAGSLLFVSSRMILNASARAAPSSASSVPVGSSCHWLFLTTNR